MTSPNAKQFIRLYDLWFSSDLIGQDATLPTKISHEVTPQKKLVTTSKIIRVTSPRTDSKFEIEQDAFEQWLVTKLKAGWFNLNIMLSDRLGMIWVVMQSSRSIPSSSWWVRPNMPSTNPYQRIIERIIERHSFDVMRTFLEFSWIFFLFVNSHEY